MKRSRKNPDVYLKTNYKRFIYKQLQLYLLVNSGELTRTKRRLKAEFAPLSLAFPLIENISEEHVASFAGYFPRKLHVYG